MKEMKEEKTEEGKEKFVFCIQLPLEALVRKEASYIFVKRDFFSLEGSFPLREKTFMVRVEKEKRGGYYAFIEIHAGEIVLISPQEFTFLIEDDIII